MLVISAAQTRMAITLGRLVRAGVRILLTTRDWLLKQIGNLMREGEISNQKEEIVAKERKSGRR